MPALPGLEGTLPRAVAVGDGVEVVRAFAQRALSAALFDLDGTLSNERLGWPDLMAAVNASFVVAATGGSVGPREAYDLVLADVEETIGVPTYVQMRRLTDMIAARAHTRDASSAQTIKDVYTTALSAMVAERRERVRLGHGSRESLAVPGAAALLESFSRQLPDRLFLASGTDVDAVVESIAALGFSRFFPRERIIAAGSLGPEDCAKEQVVRRLVSEQGTGEGIVTFGDGFPELVHTYRAGGIAVGVLTPDASSYAHRGFLTVAKKRRRLVEAGAHVLVSDPFADVSALLSVLESGHG
jgi:phosphoglycolate phosphatase-like HAD superfamily hydrolase